MSFSITSRLYAESTILHDFISLLDSLSRGLSEDRRQEIACCFLRGESIEFLCERATELTGRAQKLYFVRFKISCTRFRLFMDMILSTCIEKPLFYEQTQLP